MSEGTLTGGEEWRCLRALSRREHIAARQLRTSGGIEVLCPRVRQRRMTARGKVWFVEALFPGYLFARCDWLSRQRLVLATTGILGLVQFGASVPMIAARVMDDLRATFGEDEVFTMDDPLQPGDDVRLAEGPFRGARASVTRLMPARQRVAVLLDFLGTTREVEVPLLSVLGLRDARSAALSAKLEADRFS